MPERGAGALVAIFPSIHRVMAAERALQGAGLPCDLVPTPRAVSYTHLR
ncbi:MAG: DUF3343 domain-containing protein, partial [Candidatus Eisenbacteria bacterium]|nr:DUF3343 domain-containing protein [Candidatus Eisenbacteria bacterium]